MTHAPDAERLRRWQAHDASVLPYVRAHRLLGHSKTALTVLLLALAFKTQWLAGLEKFLAESFSGFSLYAAFFGTVGAIAVGAGFPFSAGGYAIERHFGLSRQSVKSWLLDQVKGLVLGAALGLIVLLFTWWALTSLGDQWWLAFGAFIFFFSVLLAQLAPVFLIPLFFKMDPLPDGELKQKLIELSARFGVSVKDVYLLGLGDKTEKGNAAFMGIGRTKRIVLGDTIYGKYPSEQVLAVFGHELGHLVHADIWRGLALSTASLFLSLGLSQWIAETWVLPRAFTWMQTPFGLLLFFVVLTLVGMPLGVVEKIHSRWRERLADGFAAEKVSMAAPLADALETLTLQNRSLFMPEGWREWLFYSHPAPWRRITRLRGR